MFTKNEIPDLTIIKIILFFGLQSVFIFYLIPKWCEWWIMILLYMTGVTFFLLCALHNEVSEVRVISVFDW